jgi:hypothetical protein
VSRDLKKTTMLARAPHPNRISVHVPPRATSAISAIGL